MRLLATPLENVITTGVTSESVEGQERALKADVLHEVEKYEGQLLLHDETEDGNNRFTLTAQWEENLTPADILTPAEVHENMVNDGYLINYARLPVTDEQAPIPRVFARLEERVEAALEHSEVALAFNCQMGRGRTTSAMVAASLVASILYPPETTALDPAKGALPPIAPVSNDTFAIREIQDPYQQGEYKIIFQLMSVLQYGKLAKRLADKAIDQYVGQFSPTGLLADFDCHRLTRCEAVQNLRKAVATYKTQWEAADRGSSKKEKVGNLAFNYLYRHVSVLLCAIFKADVLLIKRYGTLVAFANYLLEKRDDRSGVMSSSFSTLDEAQLQPNFPACECSKTILKLSS